MQHSLTAQLRAGTNTKAAITGSIFALGEDYVIGLYAMRGDTGDTLLSEQARAHDADELSHYSAGTSDIEFLYPWGWGELEGVAQRTDYDLNQHAQHSGVKLDAVVYGDDSVTYAELEARANRLAHRLRALGVGAETRVGLCMERSVALIVALLGILKAGAAYVPMDPDYPEERLGFMLGDSRVTALLTHRGLQRRLPAASVPVIDPLPPVRFVPVRSPGSILPMSTRWSLTLYFSSRT